MLEIVKLCTLYESICGLGKMRIKIESLATRSTSRELLIFLNQNMPLRLLIQGRNNSKKNYSKLNNSTANNSNDC